MLKTNKKPFYNEVEKIWYGEQVKPSYGPNDSIGKVILEALLKYPQDIGQICHASGKEYTNIEIAKLSICFAKHFENIGLEQGDVIGVDELPQAFKAPILFGAMFRGLCLSHILNICKHLIGVSKPKIIFCDGNSYQMIKETLDEYNLWETKVYTTQNHIEGVSRIDEILHENIQELDYKVPTLKWGYNQTAVIISTSGTTGLTKGVELSHNQLLNTMDLIIKPPCIYLTYQDYGWVGALVYTILAPIYGITIIIPGHSFSTESFFDIVEKYKVNIVSGSPGNVKQLLQSPRFHSADLKSLKIFITGGSALPYKFVEEFKVFVSNVVFLRRYSMSEMAGLMVLSLEDHKNAYGLINVNTAMKILHEDTGVDLGPNEVGVICVRSASRPWSGYYQNPQETQKVLDSNGFIHTGDLGYFDSNDSLHILDRRVDRLLYIDCFVSPFKIEKVILELPQVADCCVVGIDDVVYVQLPAAAVVLKPNMSLTKDVISQHIKNKMEDYEQLRGGVYFFDIFPLTQRAKLDRRKVKEVIVNLKTTQTEKLVSND